MECRLGEYVCVLVDGAVLYYLIAGTANLHNLVETAIEEVYLQVETPSLHEFIKSFRYGLSSTF